MVLLLLKDNFKTKVALDTGCIQSTCQSHTCTTGSAQNVG